MIPEFPTGHRLQNGNAGHFTVNLKRILGKESHSLYPLALGSEKNFSDGVTLPCSHGAITFSR